LAVSVEAIFLSTFVLIGQDRQSEFQQAKADHEIHTEEQELSLNTELTRQIHNSQRNCMSMFSANRQRAIRRSDDQTAARSGRAQTCFDVTR
jgi:uncharacterized membrane protein